MCLLASGSASAMSMQELFDYAMAFGNQPRPGSDRIAIVTNAGGPAAGSKFAKILLNDPLVVI